MTTDLPSGWTKAKLDEIAMINPPGALTTVPDGQEVTFIPMAAVEALTGRIDVSNTRAFGEVKKGFMRFRDGDVLFAKITPCMENGKIAVTRGLREGVGCGSTEFHVLRPNGAALPEYVRYCMVGSAFRRDAQRNMQGAVGQQRVPTDYLREAAIPVAPLAEQERIVSRIDQLFSEIDEGERALERVQKLVERYRQSVLGAAFTGILTRAWRNSNDSPVEGSDQPVGRLPPGWTEASLGSLCSKVTSGSRDWKGYYGRGDGVFIMAQNVRKGRLDLSEVQRVDPPAGSKDAERSQVEESDLLLTIVGANTGDVCRVDRPLARHYVCQSVALIRFADVRMAPYVELFLMADEGGRAQFAETIYGAGRPHLSFDQIKATTIPLPPPEEQARIVDAVRQAESELQASTQALVVATRRSAALREAVLKAAFSGQLVPQDPTDEPASALLARLAAQPAEALHAGRGRPRKLPA